MTGRNSSHSFRENSSEFAEFLGTGAITPDRFATIPELLHSFNGATAMKPWKSSVSVLGKPQAEQLQWGHGDEAVEEL